MLLISLPVSHSFMLITSTFDPGTAEERYIPSGALSNMSLAKTSQPFL